MAAKGLLGVSNVDLSQVDDAFARLTDKAAALKPAFRELRKPMMLDQKSHAAEAEGSHGSWPPRSPATEERRKRANKTIRRTKISKEQVQHLKVALARNGLEYRKRMSKPKRLLGRLPTAFTLTIGGDFIRMVSRAPWSRVHQEGGRAGRNRRVVIPKREFFWISQRLMEETQLIFASYILKGWKA
jgi:phage gpG-like protein